MDKKLLLFWVFVFFVFFPFQIPVQKKSHLLIWRSCHISFGTLTTQVLRKGWLYRVWEQRTSPCYAIHMPANHLRLPQDWATSPLSPVWTPDAQVSGHIMFCTFYLGQPGRMQPLLQKLHPKLLKSFKFWKFLEENVSLLRAPLSAHGSQTAQGHGQFSRFPHHQNL